MIKDIKFPLYLLLLLVPIIVGLYQILKYNINMRDCHNINMMEDISYLYKEYDIIKNDIKEIKEKFKND